MGHLKAYKKCPVNAASVRLLYFSLGHVHIFLK